MRKMRERCVDAGWIVTFTLASSFPDYRVPRWPRVSCIWLTSSMLSNSQFKDDDFHENPLHDCLLLKTVKF